MNRVSSLHIYPVKSLRGCAITTAEVDELGIVGDRRFMLVDEAGRFLTQRTLPRMALISTALSTDALTLSADGGGSIEVARARELNASMRNVSIWKSDDLAVEDCGDPAASWLGQLLGLKCRLVRIGRQFRRPVLKPAARAGDYVTFADAAPFLIVSESSLANLNDRLVAQGEEAMPMNRFRPNIVIAGCAAFAEDTWSRFQIGTVIFRDGGACARCPITTTDQETAERGKEPLRMLASFRRNAADPTNVDFGRNLIHEAKTGSIRVGDAVTLLPQSS